MAYNRPPKTGPDYTDKSILTQVAFKAAVDRTTADLATDEGQAEFVQVFTFLTDALFNGVIQSTGSSFETSDDASFDAAAAVTETFGATPVQNEDQPVPNPAANDGIRVAGTQHGPLPDWLFPAAKKAGVSVVYDNRDRLAENPKRPWFKGAKDQPLNAKNEPFAFWPPKD